MASSRSVVFAGCFHKRLMQSVFCSLVSLFANRMERGNWPYLAGRCLFLRLHWKPAELTAIHLKAPARKRRIMNRAWVIRTIQIPNAFSNRWLRRNPDRNAALLLFNLSATLFVFL